MATETTKVFRLEEGERYVYGFPGAPRGTGVFRGWTDFGWVAMENWDGNVEFLNVENMGILIPESDPYAYMAEKGGPS